jgi:phospholipid/cholesterol/gamma-HCH transport system substrate-binding protein
MTDPRRNYLLVGSFVIAMVVALVTWLAVLSGGIGRGDRFTIHYDNVLGVAEGTQVYFDGYPVGLVDRVVPAEEGGFELEVEVRRGWQIPEDSVAVVTASGLLSAVVIDIHAGRSERVLPPGSRIRSGASANLAAVVSGVAGELSRLVDDLGPLLDALADDAPLILEDVRGFTARLDATLDGVDALLAPANTDRIARILVNLEEASDGASSALTGLDQTRRNVDGIVLRIDELLDQSEEPIADALADLRHTLATIGEHIGAITANLESVSRNMNEFSRQLRENPGVLVRGRSVEPVGDGGAR